MPTTPAGKTVPHSRAAAAHAHASPPIELPPGATLLQGIHELQRQNLTAGPRSQPDLRRLPGHLRRQIKGSAADGKLNMNNAHRAVANEVVDTVLAKIDSLPPARQSHLPAELGVDRIPGLAHMTSTPGRRKLLAEAFGRALASPKAKAEFLHPSFALQADAFSNCDPDHPLCSMWNAGGMHAALYSGTPYDDRAVEGWFGAGKARGGGRCIGRTQRRNRKRATGRGRKQRRTRRRRGSG